MPDYFPVFLSLAGRPVVVIGGGSVATRKVRTLLRYGAEIRVVAPEIEEELQDLADRGEIELDQREYADGDLEGAMLAYVATGDRTVNEAAYEEGRRRGVWVNVVDVPAACDFISASIVNRGDLQIAVSTGGACPRLSRRIREDLSEEYGNEYEMFLRILRDARRKVVDAVPTMEGKREMVDRLLDSEILNLIREGHAEQARSLAEEILRDSGIEQQISSPPKKSSKEPRTK